MNLTTLFEAHYIDGLALSFGRLIGRLSRQEDFWVSLAAALVTRAAAEGHVFLDLVRTAAEGIPAADGNVALPIALSAAQWCAHLEKCPAVGRPGDFSPLILHRSRLYLHRFWNYEQELAGELKRRAQASAGLTIDPGQLEAGLVELFPDAPEQLSAARVVLTRPFSVISGGPGTGKTYTLAKIIVLLSRLAAGHPLRIKVAAPTGKAAARLQESLQITVATLVGADPRSAALPAEAETIHRLLGMGPNSPTPRYDRQRPLPAEMVIVDEASMIDLALMVKLVRALPQNAHLVLTGDKDQLASVEAGAVLGDICRGLNPGDGESGPVVLLRKSYRFSAQGGIGALSRAINTGNAAQVIEILTHDHSGEVGFAATSKFSEAAPLLESEVIEAFGPLAALKDPEMALAQLGKFKILSVVRQGPWGVETFNAWTRDCLRRHGLIAPMPGMSGWYAGRPIMVTRNDYFHRLFNGDTGVAVASAGRSGGVPEIVFETLQGMVRRLKPHELPAHESVYAMTVHKSQGSEFERVVLLLPDRDLPLLTRELIYTAVTRARRSVLIVGDPHLLAAAVRRRSERASGLREALA